jgi:hypothetical protein
LPDLSFTELPARLISQPQPIAGAVRPDLPPRARFPCRQVDVGDISEPDPNANALFRQVFDARAFTPLPFSGGPIEAPARAFPTAVVALLLLTAGATVAIRAAPGLARSLKEAIAAPRDGRPQALPLEEESRGGVAAYVPLQ